MMIVLIRSFVLIFALAGTAVAQPGQFFGDASRPTQLTVDEQDLLERGYISTGRQIGGGFTTLAFGFGTGQAIEGRWRDTGWIFTLGEGAATLVFTAGVVGSIQCINLSSPSCNAGRNIGLMALGAVGGLLFRAWGTIDALVGPQLHNRRVRELRARLGAPMSTLTPYVTPPGDGAGAVGGVAWSF